MFDTSHDLGSSKNQPYRVFFRFIFCYLVLFIWPFPFEYLPFSGVILAPVNSLQVQLADWVGPVLLGKQYTPPHITGSGDTSFRYTQVFIFLVMALLAALVWSIADRKRISYKKLQVVLDTLVRFYLAAILISYGLQKVFPLQFSLPTASRLAQTYGESSPMGLLWTFMGSSRLYSAFTGMGEMLAGGLLLFRSTKLPGAILAAFILFHVFMLNLSYDVPVKLFSFHLFFMAIFLIAPSTGKIVNLFRTEYPSISTEIPAAAKTQKIKWIFIALKSILIYFIFVQPLIFAWERNAEKNSTAKPAQGKGIEGTYAVSDFTSTNQVTKTTNTDAPRWKEVKLNNNTMEITYADGASIQWHTVVLSRSKRIRFASKDLSTFGEFIFSQEHGNLSLKGQMNQDSVTIIARQASGYDSPLLSRKFHWIAEEPFYR